MDERCFSGRDYISRSRWSSGRSRAHPVVVVKNNANNTVGPFTLELAVSDGYDSIVQVTLAPRQTLSVTLGPWTPVSAGSFTFTATTHLTGDNDTGNDYFTELKQCKHRLLSPMVRTQYTIGIQAIRVGNRTNDLVRSNSFTKLGGPLSGYSMGNKLSSIMPIHILRVICKF